MISYAHQLLHLLLQQIVMKLTSLLNLIMKIQFSGIREDVASHLNNFVELCDMKKNKELYGDTVKLILFPFSLRGRSKEWLLSLPKNSIDSWTK